MIASQRLALVRVASGGLVLLSFVILSGSRVLASCGDYVVHGSTTVPQAMDAGSPASHLLLPDNRVPAVPWSDGDCPNCSLSTKPVLPVPVSYGRPGPRDQIAPRLHDVADSRPEGRFFLEAPRLSHPSRIIGRIFRPPR